MKRFFQITALLIFFISLVSFSAACVSKPITFTGTCPFDGDMYIVDEQNMLVAYEQYSVDRGCYNGRYMIELYAGGDSCDLMAGDTISFFMRGQKLATTTVSLSADSTVLDLGAAVDTGDSSQTEARSATADDDSSSGSVLIPVLLLVAVLAIVALFLFHFSKHHKHRSRDKHIHRLFEETKHLTSRHASHVSSKAATKKAAKKKTTQSAKTKKSASSKSSSKPSQKRSSQ